MSSKKAKPHQGILVASRKQEKLRRRLQNEYGVQRANAVRAVQKRADALMSGEMSLTEAQAEITEEVLRNRKWTDDDVMKMVKEVTGKEA